MTLAAKLALKDRRLEVVGLPAGLRLDLPPRGPGEPALLIFVRDRSALEANLRTIVRSTAADHLTWVAYPKGGRLDTDLNRDYLAACLTGEGVHPVTQIAMDDTWSALRFRPDGAP